MMIVIMRGARRRYTQDCWHRANSFVGEIIINDPRSSS